MPAQTSAKVWAITSYFNPRRYRRRLANYRVFCRRVGIPLLTVELGYGDSFELSPDEADILVQLRREHYYEAIELRGLDEADTTELIGEFRPDAMPEHFSRALWEETKGNPFFLEEMVRHLGTAGAATEGNGAPWPTELPEGIREVIKRTTILRGAWNEMIAQGTGPESTTKTASPPVASAA